MGSGTPRAQPLHHHDRGAAELLPPLGAVGGQHRREPFQLPDPHPVPLAASHGLVAHLAPRGDGLRRAVLGRGARRPTDRGTPLPGHGVSMPAPARLDRRHPVRRGPRPDAGTVITRAEFDEGIARLQTVGFPMVRTADEAWPHFQGWRVNYESTCTGWRGRSTPVPALWSGPRRSGDRTISTKRVVNRTPITPKASPSASVSGARAESVDPDRLRRTFAARRRQLTHELALLNGTTCRPRRQPLVRQADRRRDERGGGPDQHDGGGTIDRGLDRGAPTARRRSSTRGPTGAATDVAGPSRLTLGGPALDLALRGVQQARRLGIELSQPLRLVDQLAADRRGSATNGSTRTRSPSWRQVPATSPSTRKVGTECGVFVLNTRGRTGSGTTPCAARGRAASRPTSAGTDGRRMSPSGRVAPGQVDQLRASLVAEPPQSSPRPPSAGRRRTPAHPAMSEMGAGPNPPR